MNKLPQLPDAERWRTLSLTEQMANIGSEVGRTAKWLSKGKADLAEGAFIRALDLFDLTIKYGREGQPGRYAMLSELCRARDEFAEAVTTASIPALHSAEAYLQHFAVRQRM